MTDDERDRYLNFYRILSETPQPGVLVAIALRTRRALQPNELAFVERVTREASAK
jgi:hypothetical protein